MTIGLTGGIGSGKTTVARMFSALDVPVYIADIEAKKLMHTSHEVRTAIIDAFGEASYEEGTLNRQYLAGVVFTDKDKLATLNAIVHPAVQKDFVQWKNKQSASYVIKEVAILFENGGYKHCDKIITVTAPTDVRLKRVMLRDGATEKEIKDRMQHQWPDEKKIALSDFVVNNETLENTREQVVKIHLQLLRELAKNR